MHQRSGVGVRQVDMFRCFGVSGVSGRWADAWGAVGCVGLGVSQIVSVNKK